MKLFKNLPPSGCDLPLYPWLCWGIWTSRNKLIFEKQAFSTQEVITKAIIDAKSWRAAQLCRQPKRATQDMRVHHHEQISLPETVYSILWMWLGIAHPYVRAWTVFFDTIENILNKKEIEEQKHNVPSAFAAEAWALRLRLYHKQWQEATLNSMSYRIVKD